MNPSSYFSSTPAASSPAATATRCFTTASPHRRKQAGRGRQPFQIKGRAGWQAEYVYHDGTTQRRTFATEDLASEWLKGQKVIDTDSTGPLLGGPERVTLGAFLGEYAFRFSIAKHSYQTEIDRINHYVEAIGAPRLVIHHDDAGRRELRQATAQAALPKAFKAHRDVRMTLRQKTYALLAQLARKKVSRVTTADIRQLMTIGKTEGWSDSTIQKEVALLKAAFNSAIREWRWTSFKKRVAGGV